MQAADNSPIPDYGKRLRLDDKRYIVLGAGQGMGRQTSHALHQMGARVFCVDLEAARAEQVAKEVEGIAWHADCTKREEVEKLVAEAEKRMGRIDGFIDIIGMALWAGLLDIDDESWNKQFDVVLRHAYLISQIAGRRMKETGGGTMVFVASVSALTAAPMHAAYGAAKAGLMAWVRSLAIELAPHRIRANAVAPGATLTPRMEAAMSKEQQAANHRRIPLGRMGEPADIAAAALFLSSPLSKQITGRTLVVDGGVDVVFPYTPLE
jgi:NAD(P)-dependent dehydrogenase (short-subunit alcohol dehydrogenase family)